MKICKVTSVNNNDDGNGNGQICIIAENIKKIKYLMMVIDMNKCVLLQTFIKGSGGDCSSSNQLSSLLYWESYLYTYIILGMLFCMLCNCKPIVVSL